MGPNALSYLLEAAGTDAGPAVISRGNGAWSPQTARFADEVRALATALSGYGLGEGARAAVLGSEGYGTLRAGLAVIAAGGTLVPLDPSLPDDALRRALASSGAVHAIASDERQLSRLLAFRPDLSALELLLLMTAAPSERKPAAMLVDTAIEVGRAGLAADPGQWGRAFAGNEDGEVCLIVDSGGGTRPVRRTGLLVLADAFAQALGRVRGKTVLSALPVAGIARLGAALAVLSQGATLLLPDPSERPDAGLDQHPVDSVLLDVTGLERLFRAWMEDIDARSWLGRRTTRWALRQGRSTPREGWKHRLAERLALRGLRDKLGGRAVTLQVVFDGERRASAEVESLFEATGLSIRYLSPVTGAVLAR